MKKIITLTICFVWLAVCTVYSQQTQFSNNSFEEWNTQTGLPKGWNTLSIDVPFIGPYVLSDISADNDAADGKYSVRMTPAKLPNTLVQMAQQAGFPTDIQDMLVPAVLTNATINLSLENLASLVTMFQNGTDNRAEIDANAMKETFSNLLTDGLAFSHSGQYPEKISGYYKYDQENTEDNIVLASLVVETNEQGRNIIGYGFLSPNSTKEFTQFEMPIIYQDSPTSYYEKDCELIFIAFASSFSTQANYGSPLYLDNLQIGWDSYAIGIDDVVATDNAGEVLIYPNPVPNKTFRIALNKPQKVKIYNSFGVLVKDIPLYMPNEEISLEDRGNYIIYTEDGVGKITIK